MTQRKATGNSSTDPTRNVTLLVERTERIRDLSGYQKHFKLPQRAGSGADAFVAEIASGEITRDIEEVFRGLKAAFSFKRRDTQVANPGDGTATISTPYFSYSIRVTVDPTNPAQVIWRRTIEAIANSDSILSDPFLEVFGNRFNRLEFDMPGSIQLEDLIDRLEDMEDERISLDYDPEITYCRLKIRGLSAEVTITTDTLTILHQSPVAPQTLLQSFLAIQEALFHSSEARRISFDGPA